MIVACDARKSDCVNVVEDDQAKHDLDAKTLSCRALPRHAAAARRRKAALQIALGGPCRWPRHATTKNGALRGYKMPCSCLALAGFVALQGLLQKPPRVRHFALRRAAAATSDGTLQGQPANPFTTEPGTPGNSTLQRQLNAPPCRLCEKLEADPDTAGSRLPTIGVNAKPIPRLLHGGGQVYQEPP